MNPFIFKSDDYPELIQDTNGWKAFIGSQFDQEYFKTISDKINESYESLDKEFGIYPPKNLIFKAFELTPFENVKVVLLGQGKLKLNSKLYTSSTNRV